MTTEEKAKEYHELGDYSFWKDENNIDYNSIYQFASDFHKQQVEAITEDKIELAESGVNIPYENEYDRGHLDGWINGVRWLKQQLLK